MAEYKIPKPSRDGFTEALTNNFSRAKMDDGQSRPIHIFGSQPMKNKLTWKLSWEELQMFEGWVEYTLNGGVNWFDLQISPLLPTYSYHMVSAPEYVFDEPYNRWTVTVEVERKIPKPETRPIAYYPDWPESLEDPEKEGYSFSVPDHVTHGELQGGEPGTRRRFTDKLTVYTAKWIFDFEQYETFKSFLSDDLAAGLAHFRAPFANGMGYNKVKARFVSPPVATPLGTHWVVTAQLETTAAPLVSRIMFELGGKLTFEDTLMLVDEITQIKWQGGRNLHDTVYLTDMMAQMKRPEDAISLIDSLLVEAGKGESDALALVDELLLKLSKRLSEEVVLEDSLTWAYTKQQQEVITLLEEIALTTVYKRGMADVLDLFTEEVSSVIEFSRPATDIIVLSDTGRVCWTSYIDASYFLEDYFATCDTWGDLAEAIVIIDKLTFSLKNLLTDTLDIQDSVAWFLKRSIHDSISLQDSAVKRNYVTKGTTDSLGTSDDGFAQVQDYINPDYFEHTPMYFGTKFTFLN